MYASGGDAACTSACLLSDGKRLMAGYGDGTIRLWTLKVGDLFCRCINIIYVLAVELELFFLHCHVKTNPLHYFSRSIQLLRNLQKSVIGKSAVFSRQKNEN